MSARLIAVGSGKGGVGKTWLAISLAHALAARGRRVLLFDGDLGLANLDVQLGLGAPPTDLAAVAAGRAAMGSAVLRHEAGFDVIPGRSGSGVLAALPMDALDTMLVELGRLARGYDAVLLDLGAGLGPAVRRLAARADLLLVVATDEPTSLTDAYATLKLHARDHGREARIVVNFAASRSEGGATYTALLRACTRFLGLAPALAGVVRRDGRVREAIRLQTPLARLHPSAVAALDADRIAASLMG